MGTKLLIGACGVALAVAVVGVAYPEVLGLTSTPIQEPQPVTSTPAPVAKAKKAPCGSDAASCCCAKKGKACGCGGAAKVVAKSASSCCGGEAAVKATPAVSGCCGGPASSPADSAAAIGLAATPQGTFTSAAALAK